MPGIRNKTDVRISGAAFLTGALMVLILPLKWLIAAVIAAVWHEACHLIAVKLMGGRVYKISIDNTRVVLRAESMGTVSRLICILAGPVGGILPALLIRWFPRLAICAVIHSLYNLLPIYPLDGGRALRCLAALLRIPERFYRICERGIVITMICISLYAALFLKLGLFPLLLSAIILLKTKSIKTLAN